MKKGIKLNNLTIFENDTINVCNDNGCNTYNYKELIEQQQDIETYITDKVVSINRGEYTFELIELKDNKHNEASEKQLNYLSGLLNKQSKDIFTYISFDKRKTLVSAIFIGSLEASILIDMLLNNIVPQFTFLNKKPIKKNLFEYYLRNKNHN